MTPILTSHTKGIVTIGKDLWFRDVFLFTDRLKDIAITKDVRTNWTACFRGIALTWYQSEWDGYDILRETKTLDRIVDDSITRFRDPADEALHKPNELRFTITSIEDGKNKLLTF